MKICPHCQATNKDQTKFCVNCQALIVNVISTDDEEVLDQYFKAQKKVTAKKKWILRLTLIGIVAAVNAFIIFLYWETYQDTSPYWRYFPWVFPAILLLAFPYDAVYRARKKTGKGVADSFMVSVYMTAVLLFLTQFSLNFTYLMTHDVIR